MLGRSVNVVVGKGKEHYSCAQRAENIYDHHRNTRLNKLLDWVMLNEFGDRGKLDFKVREDEWSRIKVDRCSFEKCYLRRDCHFYNMRTNISDLGNQDIIIVNQDLLIADLLRKQKGNTPLLATRPPLIIIDEAHNLESKVRSALNNSWNQKSLLELLIQIESQLSSLPTFPDIKKTLAKMKFLTISLFRNITKQIENQISNPVYAGSERFSIRYGRFNDFYEWKKQIDQISIALTSIKITNYNSRRIDDLSEQVDLLWEMILNIRNEDKENSSYLTWATYEKKITEYHSCPTNMEKPVLY